MARKPLTPPINIRGVFTVHAPFTLPIQGVFRCEAIRSVHELVKRGIDVYRSYYATVGISQAEYESDVKVGVSILTLVSATGQFVYVPNTYLASYPGMTGIKYQRGVLVCELGPIPETLDLSYLLPQVNDMVAAATGVAAATELAVIPLTSPLSHEEHVQLEATRQAAILNHTSLQEKITQLTARNDELTRQIDELVEIIAQQPELGG